VTDTGRRPYSSLDLLSDEFSDHFHDVVAGLLAESPCCTPLADGS